MPTHINTFPKMQNAAWPGVVDKGLDSEPAIALETMLSLTASATRWVMVANEITFS